MLSFLGNREKRPWEDRKNYRIASRGYEGSKCHLWHEENEVAAVRQAVWQDKRQRLGKRTLLARCGHECCVQFTHLVAATDQQCRRLASINRSNWRRKVDDIRQLVKELQLTETEIAAMLKIPRNWSVVV